MSRRALPFCLLPLPLALGAACSSRAKPEPESSARSVRYEGGNASQSRAADKVMVEVPAGPYIAGSTPEERQSAYEDYLTTSGRDTAREKGWFEHEEDRHRARLEAFRMDLTPVTNGAYAEFVADTGAPPPRIDEETWREQGFVQDYETEVERFNWPDQDPPPGRETHPVVLVTWEEAADYCAWRGEVVGEPRRLPTEDEFEKAARGPEGRIYPWGNDFDPSRLNSAVEGPRDTVPVGSFTKGASPYGLLDVAGNVFQWTSSPWPRGEGEKIVKGSAWDDWGGLGRGAARHGRRTEIRHVIVGFRCAAGA